MALSLTRTFHLGLPLKKTRLRVVGVLVGLNSVFCVCRCLVPAVSKYGVYTFHPDSAYCFEWARRRYATYVRFAAYSDVVQLGVPILPILASCITSTFIIYRSRTKNKVARGSSTWTTPSTTNKLQETRQQHYHLLYTPLHHVQYTRHGSVCAGRHGPC